MRKLGWIFILFWFNPVIAQTFDSASIQESNFTFEKILNFPDKVFSKVDRQAQTLEQNLFLKLKDILTNLKSRN